MSPNNIWQLLHKMAQDGEITALANSRAFDVRFGIRNIDHLVSVFQLAYSLWHATLYRVYAGTVGDAPCGIGREAREHPHFEQFDISTSVRQSPRWLMRIKTCDRPQLVHPSAISFERIRTRFAALKSTASSSDHSGMPYLCYWSDGVWRNSAIGGVIEVNILGWRVAL